MILFGPHTYRVGCLDAGAPTIAQSYAVRIGAGAEQIALEGLYASPSGIRSRLLFTDFRCNGLLVTDGARDTRLSQLDLDYERPLLAQGTIKEVGLDMSPDGGPRPYVVVGFDPQFLAALEPGVFGPGGAALAQDVWAFVPQRSATEPSRISYPFAVIRPLDGTDRPARPPVLQVDGGVRVYENAFGSSYLGDYSRWLTLTRAAVGKTYVQLGRYFVAPLRFERAHGALVRDVSLTTAPGSGAYIFDSEVGTEYPFIRFEGFHIRLPPPGSAPTRLVSINGDGIHSLGNRAPVQLDWVPAFDGGPPLRSSFAGMADDAVALHVRGSGLQAWAPGTQRATLIPQFQPNVDPRLRGEPTLHFRAGDQVTFLDVDRGAVLCRAWLAAAVLDPQQPATTRAWELTLGAPVAGEASCATATFDLLGGTRVYNSTMTSSPNNFVRHADFGTFRGGVRMLVSGDVSHNEFHQGGMYKVVVGVDYSNFGSTGYTSTVAPRDVHIHDNVFDAPDLSFDPSQLGGAEVNVYLRGRLSSAHPIERVVVENNLFRNNQNPSVRLSNCSGCQLLGNQLAADRPSLRAYPATVIVEASTDITVGTPGQPVIFDDYRVFASANANLLQAGVLIRSSCTGCSHAVDGGVSAAGAPLPLVIQE